MGFFCYNCNKKVRGQPVNHPCTKRKYGKDANRRVYDQSGNKGHRHAPRTVCFDFIDIGHCARKNCAFVHKKNAPDPRSKKTREKRRNRIKSTVCREWRRDQSCSHVPNCKFRHPGTPRRKKEKETVDNRATTMPKVGENSDFYVNKDSCDTCKKVLEEECVKTET